MEEPELTALRRELAAYIGEYILTPEDLEGKPYKPSIGHVLYIAAGMTLLLTLGVAAPIWTAVDFTIWHGLVFGLFAWWVLQDAVANTREAVAELIVYRWCAKRDIPRIMWIQCRDTLMKQMPSRVRWFAQFVDPPRRTGP